MLKSLSDFLTSQRDLFDEYEEKANENDDDAEEVVGYFLEKTSSGLKLIYRYWTDYLLSSTAACKHMLKFSRCLNF